MGYCPVCGFICKWDVGCPKHDKKKNQLLKKDPMLDAVAKQ